MVGKSVGTATDYRGEALVDCYIIGNNIYSRPYLDEFVDLAPANDATVDALAYWEGEDVFVAISYGTPYTITTAGVKTAMKSAGFAAITNVYPANQTNETELFRFEEGNINFFTYSPIFAAGGADIRVIYYNPDGDPDPCYCCGNISDGDAPTTVTHPVCYDKYLIASDVGTGNFYWSEVANSANWSGDYAEAESRPDNIVASFARDEQIYFFGTKTVEVWYNDGVTPFSRLTQGVVEQGCNVHQSVQWSEALQTFIWVNRSNQLVKLVGRTAVSISETLDRRLGFLSQSNSTYFSQGKAHTFSWNGRPFYFLNFALQDSFCVDLLSGNWYQWLSSSAITFGSNYGTFLGKTFAETKKGVYVGAGTATSKIYLLKSTEDQTELPRDDTTNYVRPLVRTGHIDRGDPGVSKLCKSLTFNFTKLSIDPGTHDDYTCTIYMRYRDNGKTDWSTEKTVTVVGSGENPQQLTKTVYNLGMYKTRQWEFHIVSPNFSFAIPIEDFDYVY